MALAYDNSSSAGYPSGIAPDPMTLSHTVNTADNTIIVVAVAINNASTTINGATCNGNAMTLLNEYPMSAAKVALFYISGVSAGTNNISVDLAVGAYGAITAHSFTGAVSSLSVTVSNASTGTSPTATLTPSNANSIVLSLVHLDATGGSGTITSSTDSNIQQPSTLSGAAPKTLATGWRQNSGTSDSVTNWTITASQLWRVVSVEIPAAVTYPTVTTQAASSVGKNSATANGNITNTGNDTPTKRGFVYDTTSRSLPSNGTAPGSTAYAYNIEDTGSYSTGAYTGSLSGLTKNTTYYVRAFSSNGIGYSYGGEVSFTTLPGDPLIDAFSNADDGFVDITDGGDSDPFDSGDHITYTAQIELEPNTTYYWRVRGKDPSGSNTYGEWSEIREFTVSSGERPDFFLFFE